MTQQTFTEKEIQGVADFVNFVYKKASWHLTTKENQQLTKYLANMAEHIKKMDAHKMELTNIIPAPEKKKGKK